MTDITIPPEVEEILAVAIAGGQLIWKYALEEQRKTWRKEARAACLAMLRAWPSKSIHNDHLHWPEYPHIILPLPQENTNAE